MSTPCYIAVFGDAHGHLRLLLQLCRLWQRHSGEHLAAILQCGDLGYFPDPNKLDKATRRFAEDDPEELGFSQFFLPPDPPQRDALLERILRGSPAALDSVTAPLYWCHGNHEDFDELSRLIGREDTVEVDAFGAFTYVRSGATITIGNDLIVGAIGGAPECPGDPPPSTMNERFKRVDLRAADQLLGQRFDVLISHGAPSGLGGESDRFGSDCLRSIDELCQPSYHFFGHHRKPIAPGRIASTQCTWLDDVTFVRGRNKRLGRLRTGCMGLLTWHSTEDHTFEIIDDPWIRGVHATNWQHL